MKTLRGEFFEVIVKTIANTHSHTREVGPVMKAVIREATRGGADVLGLQPNTDIPLTTAERVVWYNTQAKILVPRGHNMSFIPFVMLTEETTYEELVRCVESRIYDGKIYPYMRTTKSQHGVRQYGKILQVVRWCAELGINVHVHFEHPNMIHSNRDAEYLCLAVAEMFLETGAVVFWEHGSDGRCVEAWKNFAKTGRFFLTLTAHHLAWNEDEAFGDVRKKCKPPIKTERDRLALIQLVSEDHSWVMLGADDAAHDIKAKHVHERKCACGAFTSPFLLGLVAHALHHLLQTKRGIRTFINFTSRNARRRFNLPEGREIRLIARPFIIPAYYKVGPWTVEPPGVGEKIQFQIAR